MLSWLLSRWINGNVQSFGVGTKVRLPNGDTGIVSGGQLNVDLDAGSKLRPLGLKTFRVNVTHTFEKVQLLN